MPPCRRVSSPGGVMMAFAIECWLCDLIRKASYLFCVDHPNVWLLRRAKRLDDENWFHFIVSIIPSTLVISLAN